MTTTERLPDIVIEQHKDVKLILTQILPTVKDVIRGTEGPGLNINIIGPLAFTFQKQGDRTQQTLQAGEQRKLLPKPDTAGFRSCDPGPFYVSKRCKKDFSNIYQRLPEPKLDCLVRMAVEEAFKQTTTIAGVARELDLTPSRARFFMKRYGLLRST